MSTCTTDWFLVLPTTKRPRLKHFKTANCHLDHFPDGSIPSFPSRELIRHSLPPSSQSKRESMSAKTTHRSFLHDFLYLHIETSICAPPVSGTNDRTHQPLFHLPQSKASNAPFISIWQWKLQFLARPWRVSSNGNIQNQWQAWICT